MYTNQCSLLQDNRWGSKGEGVWGGRRGGGGGGGDGRGDGEDILLFNSMSYK